jgi:hypothetical protein
MLPPVGCKDNKAGGLLFALCFFGATVQNGTNGHPKSLPGKVPFFGVAGARRVQPERGFESTEPESTEPYAFPHSRCQH